MTAMSKLYLKYGLLYEGSWLNLHDFYIDYFSGSGFNNVSVEQ